MRKMFNCQGSRVFDYYEPPMICMSLNELEKDLTILYLVDLDLTILLLAKRNSPDPLKRTYIKDTNSVQVKHFSHQFFAKPLH